MTGDIEAILETGSVAAVEIAASALAEKGQATGVCANCGKPLIGAYCAVCGQPSNIHRRSVIGLLHEFIVDFVNVDSRVLRTARALLVEPGELPRAFREGRTQRYMPAFRLYLFVSLIFFLILSAAGIAIIQFSLHIERTRYRSDAQGHVYLEHDDGKWQRVPNFRADAEKRVHVVSEDTDVVIPNAKADGSVNENIAPSVVRFFAPIGAANTRASPQVAATVEKVRRDMLNDKDMAGGGWLIAPMFETLRKLESDPAALNGPMTTWLPRAVFLLLPLYALLLALFHIRRKDYYLVDHLVFSLSVHTFAFVALIAAIGLAQVVPGGVLGWAIFGAVSIYILLAMKRFYGQGWALTTVKFFTVSSVYTCLFLLPTMGGILFLSIVGGSFG
jgi:hypothetical protein